MLVELDKNELLKQISFINAAIQLGGGNIII